MPRRDPWYPFPASGPLPADGIASSKQRGAMAETWWSKRFVDVLESYGLGGRMERGRRYARKGQVLDLEVHAGALAAHVQGSRQEPYVVTVMFRPPTAAQWATITEAMTGKVAFAAHLLSGELPAELEDVFAGAGVALFPRTWADLRADCTCPDWGDPCKHTAAVLYLFADQLDADPWLLLRWRGRTREDILGRLAVAGAGERDDEIAPWWPFAGGSMPSIEAPAPADAALVDPDRPDAVLDSLEPPPVDVRGTPLRDLLGPAYDALR
jgi:uncharacterized Zn finger protein